MTDNQYDLVPGSVEEEHLNMLLGLTSIQIDGESKVAPALRLYFVEKMKQADISRELGIKPPLLSRKIRDIEKLNNQVAALLPFYGKRKKKPVHS